MSKTAIEVNNLNVSYISMKSKSIRNNLFSFKEPKKIVHALKDVSFSLNEGEILGVVGKNGSGKSTLLNTIAGIFSPDTGTINLYGNKTSLLSIGVGFQREINGRDNIYLNGMLLGFSEKYIDSKINEIIEFSELGEFIDMPIKSYSSGMYSKLAFSIVAVLETDIILIDEALSVGDVKFRKKSGNKMREIISKQDKTAVIVSHQESSLRQLCTKILWLNDGEIKMYGDTDKVLNAYVDFMK